MVESGGLLIRCTVKAVPRVRIPPSPLTKLIKNENNTLGVDEINSFTPLVRCYDLFSGAIKEFNS